MSSARSPSPAEGEGHGRSATPPNEGVSPEMTVHPITYSNIPMHMFPFPSGTMPSSTLRSKRRQVKNACTNCQKACKKCDDARPCLRCVKYGIAEECVDSQRKERKKGVKRGPYKKREGGKTLLDRTSSEPPEQEPAPALAPGMAMPIGMPPGVPGAPMPMMAPMGYHPAFYGQMPPMLAPASGKPGEPAYYPLIYMPPPPPPMAGQEGEPSAAAPFAQPTSQFYPTFLPYPQYPAYMVPHPSARQDGQMAMAPAPHFAYPPFYARPPSNEPSSGENEAQSPGREGPPEDV